MFDDTLDSPASIFFLKILRNKHFCKSMEVLLTVKYFLMWLNLGTICNFGSPKFDHPEGGARLEAIAVPM